MELPSPQAVERREARAADEGGSGQRRKATSKSAYSNVFYLTIPKFVEYGVPLPNLDVNLRGNPFDSIVLVIFQGAFGGLRVGGFGERVVQFTGLALANGK